MIEIKHVVKIFEDNEIKFKDIIFEDNTSYVLLGPSGCGKSTLLNLLSGNIKADGGNVQATIENIKYRLEALPKDKLQEYRRNNISYVSQEFNLFDNFTVYDNLNIINHVKSTNIKKVKTKGKYIIRWRKAKSLYCKGTLTKRKNNFM